jgi:peptide/nickel transport system permease protein
MKLSAISGNLSLFAGISAVRRYPLIPIVILIVVLVIPAAFANILSPYDPVKGDLKERLIPPFWVGDKLETIYIVSEIDVSDYRVQILDTDAQKLVSKGHARIIGGGDIKPGGELVHLIKVVEGADPSNEQEQVTLERAQDRVERAKMRVVGGGDLSIGSDLEKIFERGGTLSYPLGTDKVGRDILTRIMYGSRISIVVAAISILIAGTIGTSLGIIAGYFGGWIDSLLMRTVDISMSIPIILLALVLVIALGPSFGTVITVLVVLLWAYYARMARGLTLAVREQDYIARAVVVGASHFRIMRVHIFPNIFNSLVVLATLQVGFVIVVESTLSFLGAGIPKPTPAWGLMVADGRELIVSHWWVSFFPGFAILLVVMSMNLLGDWLRDKLDPHQRQL